MVTRRQFLKAGLAGSLALAGLGAWYGIHRGMQQADGAGFTRNEAALMAAVAAAVLAGMLPADPVARREALGRTVTAMGEAIRGLGASAQKEIGELFGLLDFPLTRGILTGIWGGWEQARPEEVQAFLQNWRHSRFTLLRSAYGALHDLSLGAWYGQAEAWAAIGYPGPPAVS